LGYLLPALVNLKPSKVSPQSLILAPTRELVQQIRNEVTKVSPNVHSVCLYGGVSIEPQIRDLRKIPGLVIACPGRLLDCISRGEINFSETKNFILDEADRMLDMGFIHDIKSIASKLPTSAQTMMFSATWSSDIKKISWEFLTKPKILKVGANTDDTLYANPNITQLMDKCNPNEKMGKIIKFLDQNKPESGTKPKVLIFTNMKRTADYVMDRMNNETYLRTASIHGDKSQLQRDTAIKSFASGKIQCLVATDVAARGLDISNVSLVINYDFPTNVAAYVHRIGRTARGDKSGTSYSLITPDQETNTKVLMEVLERADQPVPEFLKYIKPSKRQARPSFQSRNQNFRRDQYETYGMQTNQKPSRDTFGNNRSPNSNYQRGVPRRFNN